MREELVCSQFGWLAPVKDGLRNVRLNYLAPDKPREIGWAHALSLGYRRKWCAIVADDCGIELVCRNQQLD